MKNSILLKRFDKISKVLCSSATKMTLTYRELENGYGKLFEFPNGLKASVILHDGVSNNMQNNPIEVALITPDGILDDSIKTFTKVGKVNHHLEAVASTPSEWWVSQTA